MGETIYMEFWPFQEVLSLEVHRKYFKHFLRRVAIKRSKGIALGQNLVSTASFTDVYLINDGWMTGRYYIVFISVTVISGRPVSTHERLSAMKPHLQLKRSSSRAELNPDR